MLQQPQGMLQQPQGMLQQPQRMLQQPQGVIQQPQGMTQQPQGMTQQPLGMHVMPPHGITQQPQGMYQKSPVLPGLVLQQPLVPLKSNPVVQVNNLQKIYFCSPIYPTNLERIFYTAVLSSRIFFL